MSRYPSSEPTGTPDNAISAPRSPNENLIETSGIPLHHHPLDPVLEFLVGSPLQVRMNMFSFRPAFHLRPTFAPSSPMGALAAREAHRRDRRPERAPFNENRPPAI